ncbi:MAG: histidine decarboxylase [Flavobacteriales bacterium]
MKEKLIHLKRELEKYHDTLLGYPVSDDLEFTSLSEFLNFPINNIGDPFVPSNYRIDTRDFEKKVVTFFADLFRAPQDNWWGYVTNGGSESNLYGLYIAREMYPKAMFYHSESTHYSVQKNLQLLGVPSVVIRSQKNGEMNYEDFHNTLKINRHKPAVVVANIGTTMTEARDDVSKIKQILNDLIITKKYIHADAALSGGYTAFLEPKPAFDFEDGVDSIAISGHKFIGSPNPSGVVVVKKDNKEGIGEVVEYVGSPDTTITGSRNGHSPLYLWYSINKHGKEGLKKRAEYSLELAKYAKKELNDLGLNAWSNPNTITVIFDKPCKEVCEKWQLATEGNFAHIICMPSVTKERIDRFLKDLSM